jgi:hypothetical protein
MLHGVSLTDYIYFNFYELRNDSNIISRGFVSRIVIEGNETIDQFPN